MSHASSRLALPIPDLSDQADVPHDINAIVAILDGTVLYGEGTLAARPTTPPSTGYIYRVTSGTGAGKIFMCTVKSPAAYVQVNDIPPTWAYFDAGTVGAAGGFQTANWADFDGTLRPSYSTEPDTRGRVTTRGWAVWSNAANPANQPIALLPAGLRPAMQYNAAVPCSQAGGADGFARLIIRTDGVILPLNHTIPGIAGSYTGTYFNMDAEFNVTA